MTVTLDHIALSPKTVEGLRALYATIWPESETIQSFMSVEDALLAVEVAKLSPDRAEFFPLGKWATIQAIQERISAELNKIQVEEVEKRQPRFMGPSDYFPLEEVE